MQNVFDAWSNELVMGEAGVKERLPQCSPSGSRDHCSYPEMPGPATRTLTLKGSGNWGAVMSTINYSWIISVQGRL